MPALIDLPEQWRRYAESRDPCARNKLVLAYSPIVKQVAGSVGAKLPDHVDRADLVSYGFGGLLDAIERFEPARGTNFELYARRRIRGTIYDELRAQDWVPRRVRDAARDITTATSELGAQLKRMPSDAELAAHLETDEEELNASLRRIAEARVVSLDAPTGLAYDDGVQPTLLDMVADPLAADPAAHVQAAALREHVARTIERLPDNDRVVIGLHYTQDLPFASIAEVLGLSASRVSQIHSKAVLQLRALLANGV